ncbi:hypothetical protein V5O48_013319, partial [Marasmius crinis-equi]
IQTNLAQVTSATAEENLLMYFSTSAQNSHVDARFSSAADTEWSTSAIRFDNMPWDSQGAGYQPIPSTNLTNHTTTPTPAPVFSQPMTVPDVTNLPRPALVGRPVSDVGFTSSTSYKADDATATTYSSSCPSPATRPSSSVLGRTTQTDTQIGVCLWRVRDAEGNWGYCGKTVSNHRLAQHMGKYHRPSVPNKSGVSSRCSDTYMTPCYWEGCDTVLQWANVARHMRGTHFKWTEVTCGKCGKVLSRRDALKRHRCPKDGGDLV